MGLKKPLFADLIGVMRSRLVVLLPVVFMLVCAPWAHSNPAFVNATELTGRVVRSGSGTGISDASVDLFGPDNVSMDVTSTDKDGRYTIELDVLEDKELANLEAFFLQVEVKGKYKKRIGLGDGLKLNGAVIRFKDIKLP